MFLVFGFFFGFPFYLCATYSSPNSQIRSDAMAVCVWRFSGSLVCLLPSGLLALEALCTAADLELSFTATLGILDWLVYWTASLLVSFFFGGGMRTAHLLLEREECIWCNFFEIWHVWRYHLASPHIWLIQNLKLEMIFPEAFGVLASFSSTSKFALELLDAFLSMVILYVTFFFFFFDVGGRL